MYIYHYKSHTTLFGITCFQKKIGKQYMKKKKIKITIVVYIQIVISLLVYFQMQLVNSGHLIYKSTTFQYVKLNGLTIIQTIMQIYWNSFRKILETTDVSGIRMNMNVLHRKDWKKSRGNSLRKSSENLTKKGSFWNLENIRWGVLLKCIKIQLHSKKILVQADCHGLLSTVNDVFLKYLRLRNPLKQLITINTINRLNNV